MLVHHRLALRFRTAHVQEPLTWEMTNRFKNLMFNVNSLNVGVHDANMNLSLVGESAEVKKAKEYLKNLGVQIRTLASARYKGQIPKVSKRPRPKGGSDKRVERKLWLTIIRGQRREPYLWTLGRQFDIGYKITHSTTGTNMAIISLVAWGPEDEVAGAVGYLRGKGICVEYGEAGISAPFAFVED